MPPSNRYRQRDDPQPEKACDRNQALEVAPGEGRGSGEESIHKLGKGVAHSLPSRDGSVRAYRTDIKLPKAFVMPFIS